MHPATNPQKYTSDYCWIIDVDHIAEPDTPRGTLQNAVGLMGGIDSDPELIVNEPTEKFRMYDDDDNLYYEGRIAGDYEGFEPLDDFGMPNAGAVSIKYPNRDTGEWEEL